MLWPAAEALVRAGWAAHPRGRVAACCVDCACCVCACAGCGLWQAHLIATEPDKWRGKTVLELGAGVGTSPHRFTLASLAHSLLTINCGLLCVGLVGLVASLFCGQVLITDGEEEVISMIEENLQANKDALPGARVSNHPNSSHSRNSPDNRGEPGAMLLAGLDRGLGRVEGQARLLVV